MSKKYLTALLIPVSCFLFALAFPAMADEATSTTPVNTVDLACMQAAVEKRENAIETAFDTFSTAIKSALQTRKTELLAAWAIESPTQRKTAIWSAWRKFKESKRSVALAFHRARYSAWQQFKTDRKACGNPSTHELYGSELKFYTE